MVMTIAARPPDVPLRRPACKGFADVPLQAPAAVSGLVSVCVNPAAYAPDVMVIYNLSDDVLGIRSASASQPALRAYYPAPASPLPPGDGIESYAQSAAVRGLASGGAVLLPVGGQVIATQDVPIRLAVQVNRRASAASYAAQVMTGYVVDNLTRPIGSGSARSYQNSIADCVRQAPALWRGLYEGPAADAAPAIRAALAAVPACRKLQDALTSDRAEALSVAATSGRLTAKVLQQDLATVASAAGQRGWESHLDGLAKSAVTIAEAAH
jgi:hypothetical protein